MVDNKGAEGFDAAELIGLFKKAASSGAQLSTAFGMASKPEGIALIASLTKPAAMLKSQVKDVPTVDKICWGTITVDGKNILLAAEKPIPMMAKALQRRMKDEGMAGWKALVVDASGAEIDDEAPSDTGDEVKHVGAGLAQTSGAEAKTAGTSGGSKEAVSEAKDGSSAELEIEALKVRLSKISRALTKLSSEQGAKLVPAYKVASKQIAEKDGAAASKSLAKIEEFLARLLSGAGKAAVEADEEKASEPASAAPDQQDAKQQAASDEEKFRDDADAAEAKRAAEAEKAAKAATQVKLTLARLLKDLKTVPAEGDRVRLGVAAREVSRLLAEPDLAAAARALQQLQAAFETALTATPPGAGADDEPKAVETSDAGLEAEDEAKSEPADAPGGAEEQETKESESSDPVVVPGVPDNEAKSEPSAAPDAAIEEEEAKESESSDLQSAVPGVPDDEAKSAPSAAPDAAIEEEEAKESETADPQSAIPGVPDDEAKSDPSAAPDAAG